MHCFDEREKCEHFRFNKCGVMHLPRGGGMAYVQDEESYNTDGVGDTRHT